MFDVWATNGAWGMLRDNEPLRGSALSSVLVVINTTAKERLSRRLSYDHELCSMILRCVGPNKDRPSWVELLNHFS